jgi:glycosyltransferase involved in cell wall biosynthesis
MLDGQVRDRRGDALSLYWFSQTVGLDRGIQDVILAAGRLVGPVQIHLRGHLTEAVRAELLSLAADCGVSDALYFHAPVCPKDLLSRSAEHDVGLALEPGARVCHRVTVSNKLFVYMTAGLAIVATDVPGQRAVLGDLGEDAFLYRSGGHGALAAHLEELRSNRGKLLAAKKASLAAARQRWNWEMESKKLLAAVERALAREDGQRPARTG